MTDTALTRLEKARKLKAARKAARGNEPTVIVTTPSERDQRIIRLMVPLHTCCSDSCMPPSE